MTNLEKWKSELTPENAHEFFTCDFRRCPAYDYCKNQTGLSCAEKISKWANAEAVIESVEPKGETCPKCGADAVIVTEVKIRRCSKCGYEFVPCPCGKTIRPANSALQYCEYCHTYFGTNDPEKDTVPWEKPQTNFDKWKEKLTPEDFVRMSNTWCGNFPFCGTCEADDGRYCHNIFYRWADAPAEEEK